MKKSIRNLFMDGVLTFDMWKHWRLNKNGSDLLVESEDTANRLPREIASFIIILSAIISLCLNGVLYNKNSLSVGIFVLLIVILVIITWDIGIILRWKKNGFIHRELVNDCAIVYELLSVIGRNCMDDLTQIDGLELNEKDTLNPAATHSHEDLVKIFNHLLYERTDLLTDGNVEEKFRALCSFGLTRESWQEYLNNSKRSKVEEKEDEKKLALLIE